MESTSGSGSVGSGAALEEPGAAGDSSRGQCPSRPSSTPLPSWDSFCSLSTNQSIHCLPFLLPYPRLREEGEFLEDLEK